MGEFLVREEAGCEGLLDVGNPGEGCGVWEVEVGESHFGIIFGGESSNLVLLNGFN